MNEHRLEYPLEARDQQMMDNAIAEVRRDIANDGIRACEDLLRTELRVSARSKSDYVASSSHRDDPDGRLVVWRGITESESTLH